MPITDAQKRAAKKYMAANYKRICLAYPNAFCEALRKAAEQQGQSLAAYIRQAVEERMKKDGG